MRSCNCPVDDEPYAGITIYQERGNTSPLSINGDSGSDVSGFIRPERACVLCRKCFYVRAGDCIRIVGKTIELTGNANVSADCEVELDGREINAGRQISLVR
jgi:hypothetical protein